MINVKEQWYLVQTTCIVLINFMETGIIVGWTSPILSVIQSANSTIPTTTTEGTWMATIIPLVSIFSTPLAATSIHVFGRKISLLLTAIPFLVSWTVISFSKIARHIIYGRAVGALGQSFAFTVIPVYLAEISPSNMRSGIGLSMSIMTYLGVLYIYAFGALVDLWISSILCSIPSILFLVMYKFIPESPYYLIKENKIKEGKNILRRLRNNNIDIEFERMQESVAKIDLKDIFKELWSDARHKRALFISIMIHFISYFTGGITLIYFAHTIFEKAGDTSSNTLSLIKASASVLSSIFAAYIVEKIGNRPLLMLSCIGSSVFMAAEGTYFYLLDNNFNVDQIWWLPIVAMILFDMSQAIGLLPISISFMGELFDTNVKPVSVCISKMSMAAFIFIVGVTFQILIDNFGNATPFFVYSVIGILGLFFVIFFIPETKGKTLQDIQYYFKHNTYDRKEINEDFT